ncbi:MAG: hypothetical protein JNM17_16370 [Archangium sp.]|nr:hypothetical protein [Archangium sp.]
MTVPHLDAQLAVLSKEAYFTLDELAVNRTGKLHPDQIGRDQPGNGAVAFWVVLALLILGGGNAGALLFYDSLRKPVDRVDMNGVYAIAIGSTILGLGCIAFAISTLRSVRASRKVYELGLCVTWDITFDFSPQEVTFKDYFYIRKGDEQLLIPKRIAKVMRHSVRYRVYIGNGRLISLEPLE